MKTLNWYIVKNFLIAFGMSIGILTFCMLGARLVQVLEFVARGAPLSAFGQFLLYVMPIVLTFTIPLSVLVSIMLVFGRMAADSEITAMRACGISILQLVSPIMIITILLTAFCLYLQVQVGPPWLGKARYVLQDALTEEPMAFFRPGESISYDNRIIYVDDIVGENGLKDIQIFEYNKDESINDYRAAYGEIHVDQATEKFSIVMHDCEMVTAMGDERVHMRADQLEFTFDFGKERNSRNISQRPKHMTLEDLMARIRIAKVNNEDTCELEVELNQRIAFALSPIAFLLLGIPMAIHTSRRETSVGLFIGAIAGGVLFLAIILCESLTKIPQIYPQYLLWLPNLLYQVAGAYMVYKITRK